MTTRTEFPVSAQTEPSKLGSSIAYAIKANQEVELKAIGAAAVNQAIKGVAVARSFAVVNGNDLVCVPWFSNSEIGGVDKTTITILVKRQ